MPTSTTATVQLGTYNPATDTFTSVLDLNDGTTFFIANGGLKLNDVAVSDPKASVDASALNADGVLKLSSGKKKHVLVRPV